VVTDDHGGGWRVQAIALRAADGTMTPTLSSRA
jgi:hypothetical protein